LRHVSAAICVLAFASVAFAADEPFQHESENIIFVMTDGLRWQEVFRGADASLMTKEEGKLADPAALKTRYWRDSLEERRGLLMPFLWNVVARKGQIYGNRTKGSDAFVTNGLNFSYPGYSEALCGFPDPRIKSNDNIPNPNTTVLEWLGHFPEYRQQLAAFGAWDVISAVFNPARSGLVVNAGWDPFTAMPITPRLDLLNELKTEAPRIREDKAFDAIPFYTAVEYLKERKPKVLYISFGETDDWAHAGRYGEYLDAAHRVDKYLDMLWTMVQEMPEYRGHTTLIISTDHGRGDAPVEWKDHGEHIPDSKYIWIAFLGPDTSALGERSSISPVTQSQIAATLAGFVGKNYTKAVPQAGKPIQDAFKTGIAQSGTGVGR
jgi:hypothetical protein